MKQLSPVAVLRLVAAAVPEECRERLIVVGSVAAGYHLLSNDPSRGMRTKDVDCVLAPRVQAVATGEQIAARLLLEQWTPLQSDRWAMPGDENTPDGDPLEHHPAGVSRTPPPPSSRVRVRARRRRVRSA